VLLARLGAAEEGGEGAAAAPVSGRSLQRTRAMPQKRWLLRLTRPSATRETT